MAFKDTAVCRSIVVPDPDRGISRTTSNQETRRVDRNIINWTFMANEFVGTRVGFQRSGEDNSVVGA